MGRQIILRSSVIFAFCSVLLLAASTPAVAASKYVSPQASTIQRAAVVQSIVDCYHYAADREFKMSDYVAFGKFKYTDKGNGHTYGTTYELMTGEEPDDNQFSGKKIQVTNNYDGKTAYDDDYSYFGTAHEYMSVKTNSVVATNRRGVTVFGNGATSGYAGMSVMSNGTYGGETSNSFYDTNLEGHYMFGQILTGLLPDDKVASTSLPFVANPSNDGHGNGLARLPQGYAIGMNYPDHYLESTNYTSGSDPYENSYNASMLDYDTTYFCEDFFSDEEFTTNSGLAFAGMFNEASTDKKQVTAMSRDDKKIAEFLMNMGYTLEKSAEDGYCSRFSFMKEHHDRKNAVAKGLGKLGRAVGINTDMGKEDITKETVVTPFICVQFEADPPHKLLKVYQKDQVEGQEYYEQYNGIQFKIDGDQKGFTLQCQMREGNIFGSTSMNGCQQHYTASEMEDAYAQFTNFVNTVSGAISANGKYKNTNEAMDALGWAFGSNYTVYYANEMAQPTNDKDAKNERLEINGNYDLQNGIEIQDMNLMNATLKLSKGDDGLASAYKAASWLVGDSNANVGTGNAGSSVTTIDAGLTETEKEILYRHYLLDFYGGAGNTYCIANGASDTASGAMGGTNTNAADSISAMANGRDDLWRVSQNASPKLITYIAEGDENASAGPVKGEEHLNANTLDGSEHGDYYELILLGNDAYYYRCYVYPNQNQNMGVFGVFDDGHFFKYVYLEDILKFLASRDEGLVGQPNKEVDKNASLKMYLDSFEGDLIEKRELNCYGKDLPDNPGLGIMALIFCPIIEHASAAVQGMYSNVIETFLVMPSDLYGSGSVVESSWRKFLDIANLILLSGLVLIIFSQVTGWKVSVFGVRALLPRWILWTILTNLSFVICGTVMDFASMFANSSKTLMEQIITGALGHASMTFAIDGAQPQSIRGSGMVIVALVAILGSAIIITKGGVLVGLLSALFSAVIAIIGLFIYLATRQAALLLLVAISPIAFASGSLPNTKKLFDSWWGLFTGLVMVFPICSFLVYGGDAAAKLIIIRVQQQSGASTGVVANMKLILELISAVLCTVAPIFLIPTVVKNAVGAISGAMSALSSGTGLGAALGRGAGSGSALASAGAGAMRTIGRRANASFARRSVFGRNRILHERLREDRQHYRKVKSDARHAKFLNRHEPKNNKPVGERYDPLSYASYARAERTQTVDALYQHDLKNARTAYAGNSLGLSTAEKLATAQNDFVKRGIGSSKPDYAAAMAGIEFLQQSEEFGTINKLLMSNMSSSSFSGDEMRRQDLANLLASSVSDNAAAGLYGEFMREAGHPSKSFADFVNDDFGDALAKGGAELLVGQDKDSLEWMANNVPQEQLDKITDEQVIESFKRMNAKQQKQFAGVIRHMSKKRREQIVDSLGSTGITDLKLSQIRALNNTHETGGVTSSEKIVERYLNSKPAGKTVTRADEIRADSRRYSRIDESVKKELGL